MTTPARTLADLRRMVPVGVVRRARRQAGYLGLDPGWEAHRGRQAFEDDRARDAYLRLQGYEVLRFSWRQVMEDSRSVVAVLRRYLT